MVKCWPFLLAAAAVACAQEASAPDWRSELAGAREAYTRLSYSVAAEKAAAAVQAAGAQPDNQAGALEALRLFASVQRAQGKFADAAQSLHRAAELCAALHGAQSQQAAGALAEIAAVERTQRHFQPALEAIQKAIAVRESSPGLRPEDLARDLTTAASLLVKVEDKEKARSTFHRAVDLWNTALPGDPQILPALEALANLYRDASQYAEAEPLLVHALRIREAATGPDGPEVIALVDSLAYVYFGMKRFTEAESCYKRLLDLWEKAAGTEHPMRALTLDKMAEFYAFQQRYAEGEKAATEALAMRTRLHLASLNQTGRLILMQARLTDAQDLYRRAVEIGDLAKAPDEAMDPLLRIYAKVLREMKKDNEAQALEARIMEALLRKADREGRLPPPGKGSVPPPSKR
jgi:tetratricopeptide (TPR) repeat protein